LEIFMRAFRFALLGSAVAVVGACAVVGCATTGEEGVFVPDLEEPETGGGSVLPPSSDDAGAPADAGKDSGKKDGGSDAGKDAGPPAPQPGTACAVQDQIAPRSCGKCGKQEAICGPTDGGLAWSEYGPCSGELGACLPGATQACGNCGTQTCSNTCGWAACGGQPVKNCSPGTVDFTTAGCATGGFRSRSCKATCEWESYSATCDTPKAVDAWAGGPGAYSTFMRGNDGKVYAWGLDEDGQLGDSDTANKGKMTPTPFSNVVSMNAGGVTTYGFACASFVDKSAKCWGYLGTTYTLGDGLTSTSPTGIIPTGFDMDVTHVVGGYAHGCGLFVDGTAKCWGYNTYGQLGNSTTTTSKTPVTVNLTDITRLSSGYYTLCALKTDAAYCWGYNSDGQVGDGTTTARSTPTLVIPSGVASLAPGYYHSCAVMTDGTAKCWGQATNGEIGDGTASSTDVTSPRTVLGIDGVGASLGGVAEICTGWGTSCARLTDGRVACWGRNADGQLGVGDPSITQSSVPKIVSGIATATKLVCGYKHACVVQTDGRVKCWGDNLYGQIGNGAMPVDAFAPQETTF
jgi:alpha-tubulin suppressor-like RCC1 family protein